MDLAQFFLVETTEEGSWPLTLWPGLKWRGALGRGWLPSLRLGLRGRCTYAENCEQVGNPLFPSGLQ